MNKIINILKKRKSMPLDKFINIALYEKNYGYYMKKNPFGEKGDFITSPLISNLFAEMLAIWCIAFWENLGKPKKILIVELGPGDGSLCKDLLKTFKLFKLFNKSVQIKLLEISEKLKKIQKTKIGNKKVKWIKKIEDIRYGPVIFIGNEFFDSLPIKQIHKKRNIFFEKYIKLSKDKKKIKIFSKKANIKLIKKMKNFNLLPSKNIIEYPIDSLEYLKSIAKIIKKFNGGLLVLDYGYLDNKNINTVQSIQGHKYTNFLNQPGEADITSHVNFGLYNEVLKKNDLNVEKIIPQSEFLQKMGIIQRANLLSNKMTFKEKANMFYRLKRLLNYSEMGNLFKVFFAKKKNINFSLGF